MKITFKRKKIQKFNQISETNIMIIFRYFWVFPLFFLQLIWGQYLHQFEQEIIKITQQAQNSVVKLEISYSGRKIQRISSGIILDSQGHIVTIANAVKEKPTVYALFSDYIKTPCYIVGYDKCSNLAVLKLADTKYGIPIPRGESQNLQLGSFLITMGNPYGLTNSITLGIVSGLNRCAWLCNGQRPLTGLIQTTATINPGDDGGLVLDSKGCFVGMILGRLNNDFCISANYQVFVDFSTFLEKIHQRSIPMENLAEKLEQFIKLSQKNFEQAPSENIILPEQINFILPSQTIYWVSEQIIKHGKVNRGWLGIKVKDVYDSSNLEACHLDSIKVTIVGIEPHSPAQKSGLKAGDILTSCNNKPILNMLSLLHQSSQFLANQEITLTYQRNKKEYTVTITLATENQ